MNPSSSTATPQPLTNSSTTQLSAEQVYARQLANLTKPQSPAQIRAHGEVKIKLGVLWLVGTVSVVLGGFGCISFLMTPDKSKDLWVIIGPIISAGVTGVVAFLTGEKQGAK